MNISRSFQWVWKGEKKRIGCLTQERITLLFHNFLLIFIIITGVSTNLLGFYSSATDALLLVSMSQPLSESTVYPFIQWNNLLSKYAQQTHGWWGVQKSLWQIFHLFWSFININGWPKITRSQNIWYRPKV